MHNGWLRLFVALVALLGWWGAVAPVHAQPPAGTHVTDGKFTTPNEWDTSRNTVTRVFFSQVADGSGGAWLYVEQGFSSRIAVGQPPDTLFLMYDYVKSTTDLTPTQGHNQTNS